jgi:hypothetical protein
MVTTHARSGNAHVGDWVEARGIYGQPSRRGQIVEVLGGDRHERYRVQWDEKHESILYPADGVVVVPRHRAARQAVRSFPHTQRGSPRWKPPAVRRRSPR